jgi:tRNA pseudouridine65 synthase
LLPILYIDEHIVAIDKPPGLLVHRSPIDPHASTFAVQQLRDQLGRYVFPIYRLDRPTSGVLLFAFDAATTQVLAQQWQTRQVQKGYTALVRGHIRGAGMIDYSLVYQYDDYGDADKQQVQKYQKAVSEFLPQRYFTAPWPSGRYVQSRYSVVELSLWHGRKHQLRRHLAHFRHPIIGDTTHGDGKQNKAIRQFANFHELALSCTMLGFHHPITHRYMLVRAPVHTAFAGLIDRLGPFEVV